MEKHLKVQKLSYKNLLHDITFQLRQGETVVLMGRNGSGKSTIARLLAGLIQPTSGVITLWDDDHNLNWEPSQRWQTLAYVGQHPRRQTIGCTVGEELSFGLFNIGLKLPEVKDKVVAIAEKFGLKDQLDQSPATLSGGERQRLVLAAFLALEPTFIVLDESLSMLDQIARNQIINLLEGEKRNRGIGQLWITHDPELALKGDRLLLMNEGRLTDMGLPERILKDLSICQTYGLRPLGGKEPFVGSTLAKPLSPLGTRIPETDQRCLDEKTENTAILWEDIRYANGVEINQRVQQGEMIAIVGPSGSGKTTVVEGICGLRKPVQGKLQIFSTANPPDSHGSAIKNGPPVQLLQQEAGEYLIGRTVYDEVFYTVSKKEREQHKIEHREFLLQQGFSDKDNARSPEGLSGGERQKVALASLLYAVPNILLLDEPVLGLDAPARNEFLLRLHEIRKGRTILYITHDLTEVKGLADRIWTMEKGRILSDTRGDGY